jgi:hypothetical protein
MKRIFALIIFVLLAFCIAGRAQDVSNLYLAGASYSPQGQPSTAGSAIYAHQVNGGGTYAFTMIDALPASVKPFTVSTNIGVGIAQRVATIGKYDIFMPTAAGISFTGANVGWQWNTGVGVPMRFKESNLYIMPNVRVLKSSVSGGAGYQPIIGVLFGWGQ